MFFLTLWQEYFCWPGAPANCRKNPAKAAGAAFRFNFRVHNALVAILHTREGWRGDGDWGSDGGIWYPVLISKTLAASRVGVT